ncbi:MAG TPA: hypothetical protein VMZ53_23580 [Kofleriaceae bacterium]|nr:hypothetical protein [Kofleriaceae bacterium]
MTTVGTKCIVKLGTRWTPSTIVRCNPDQTFDIVPIGEEDDFMAKWHGVTRSEILIDDAAAWPDVFDSLRGGAAGIDSAAARAAFGKLGATFEDESWHAYWDREAKAEVLDRERAYEFFVGSGAPALLFANPSLDPSRDLFKLYWNQVRMGGRDPSDVDRAITIVDTVRVLGLAEAAEDPEQHAAIARFATRHRIKLPATLETLWGKADVLQKIEDSHCNNPEPQGADDWQLRDHEGRHAARIMLPHQGDHAWWAVFADGAPDAEIWVSFEEDGGPVRRVAHSLAFFFWDLAKTGRSWDLSQAAEDAED